MTYCAPTTYHSYSCKSNDWNASSISGRYSLDANRDNTERNGSGFDAGVAGKKVYLLDSYGRVVASTTTSDDGSYKFAQLKAGYYQVAFESVTGHSFATKDVGDGRYDSDVNSAGKTGVICLSSCQNICDIDASIQSDVGKISGSVFSDIGCDGINGQLTQVPGACYVMEAEAMCRSGSLGVYSGSEASGGRFVKLACGSTGTLSDRFDGKSGTYDVVLRVQDENDGQSTIRLKVDGVVVSAVRLDRNTDGAGSDNGGFSDFVITGVRLNAGSKIELLVSGDAGEYVRLDKVTFQGAPVTTLVAEPPKAGVKIVLMEADGDVVATTYTDANGNYRFDNVPTGQYRVMGEAPDGTKFTLKDAGSNDAIDSDVGANGQSDLITVTKGACYDIDLGLCTIKKGALEGRYFFDADRGNTDNGDAGIEGKTVTLYAADGVTVIATTTTDADGRYSFTNLAPGSYVVGFQDSASEHRSFVAANVGGDDTIDSDANAGTGLTGVVSVLEGQTTKDVDVGVSEDLGALEGRYFFDAGRDDTDNGDAGVEGKTVTLYAADGVTVITTTTTGADGSYSFTGLAAGSYVVGFEDSSAQGRAFVAANAGGDDTIDSDANATTGVTGIVSVLAGQTTKDVDAGVYLPNDPPVALDDAGKTCADETLTIDLLGNDSDPNGNPISVVSISDEDETVTVGGTLTLASGAKVTLNADGTVTHDGTAAWAGLTIGQSVTEGFSYTITDGEFTASADVDVTICGELNTAETIDARVFQGATATFTVQLFTFQNAIDGYTITLNSINIPNDFHDPKLTVADLGGPVFSAVYCLDSAQDISANILTTATLGVATEGNALEAGLSAQAASRMDSVNWILNQNFTAQDNGDGNGKTFTDLEVQEAIWVLLNGDVFLINNPLLGAAFADNNNGVRDGVEKATVENAMDIYERALAEGDGFEVGAGQILGLILNPTAPAVQDQPMIIGVRFDLFVEDCLCA
ncbi:SdrD B-like domain-containing protein [Stagnihabitans tardus]|uniref:Uncharacterized protein n=1 Tax=Stagnihabitans tardus TaxID=2699202 RepID=A0AAE4Y9R1_9RHOB|nr:SdrD B-like domain-containing protein [Stagnihabitans tardus]NBZ87707.1 hypothetical protein [Stagnihabitans tardus]